MLVCIILRFFIRTLAVMTETIRPNVFIERKPSRTHAIWFLTRKIQLDDANFVFFFFGTLKLGFCPIITIITSGFHFSCREYIFLKFFFSLIFVTFVVYMLCHQKMDLSVLCILAFEWVVHGNRYALNNRKAFYWLWNRSYISFPLISLPISEHYMLAELHLYIELMGFFSRFSAPFSCFHEW